MKADYIAFTLPGTQTNLELITYHHPQGSPNTMISKANQIGFRHMAIEVTTIESVVAGLKEKGITFLSDIQTYEETHKKLCYFLGPEKILLELCEYLK